MPGIFDAFKNVPPSNELPMNEQPKTKAGMFAMMDAIAANSEMLKKLPGFIDQWNVFMKELVDTFRKVDTRTEKIDANVTRIICILEPGGVTDDIHAKALAMAQNDPRQKELRDAPPEKQAEVSEVVAARNYAERMATNAE